MFSSFKLAVYLINIIISAFWGIVDRISNFLTGGKSVMPNEFK